MFRFYLLCNVLATISCANPTVVDQARNISYTGITSNGIDSFLGIPFAEDVGGTKRFTRPIIKRVASGTNVNATKPGPSCPQQRVPISIFPLFSNVTEVAEDCLNLRIDRPAGTESGAKLPVMVYIYGGGDSIGQAYDRLYTPTGLLLGAQAKKMPVIYVAMNYRLNIFGFASSNALNQEKNSNVGLLDQRLALEWVQQNIACFGGNPEKVTVFGESDGATSIGLQITAHGGKGKSLFQQAIMQSGSPASDGFVDSDFSANSTTAVANSLGCNSGTSKKVLKCLRNVPFRKLLKATLKFEKTVNEFGFDAFIPSVDKDFIPDTPSKLVRSGRFHKDISIMIGWNRDDSSLFTPTDLASQKEVHEYLLKSQPGFTQSTVNHLLSLYPASNFHSHYNVSRQYYRTARLQRDFVYPCPSLDFALAVQKFSNAKAYIFQLDQTPLTALFNASGNLQYGVSHFSDIFYVFNELKGLPFSVMPSDYTVASQMSGSWAQFAWTGVPGSDEGHAANATLSAWPEAFTKAQSGKYKASVFAIGGDHQGPVVLGPETNHAGLENLLGRCAYMSTPQFYNQLAT